MECCDGVNEIENTDKNGHLTLKKKKDLELVYRVMAVKCCFFPADVMAKRERSIPSLDHG